MTDPLQVVGFVGLACVLVSGGIGAAIAAYELRGWWQRRRARRALAARRAQVRLTVVSGSLAPNEARAREWPVGAEPPEWGWPARS